MYGVYLSNSISLFRFVFGNTNRVNIESNNKSIAIHKFITLVVTFLE